MTDFNSAPQPRTFAPGKEDVLQNLQYFFGAPVSPEKLKDYSEHHAMTMHFPDAYVGQNVKIRDTLNNLILKSPQSWQTSVRCFAPLLFFFKKCALMAKRAGD